MSLLYFAYTTDLEGFKPCPFCGRTGQEIFKPQQVRAKNHDSISFSIHCRCGCILNLGVRSYGKPDENMTERKERKKLLKLIQEAWNARRQG